MARFAVGAAFATPYMAVFSQAVRRLPVPGGPDCWMLGSEFVAGTGKLARAG